MDHVACLHFYHGQTLSVSPAFFTSCLAPFSFLSEVLELIAGQVSTLTQYRLLMLL